jgi:hypothetical protein
MAGTSESNSQSAGMERRRIVRPAEHGRWAVCLPDGGRAIAILPTCGDAIARAKRILAGRGGGTIDVCRDGQNVQTLTVQPRSTRRLGHVLAQRRVSRRSVPRDPSAPSS